MKPDASQNAQNQDLGAQASFSRTPSAADGIAQRRISNTDEGRPQFPVTPMVLENVPGETPPSIHTPKSSSSEHSLERQADSSGHESPTNSDSVHVSPARFGRLSLRNDQPLFNAPAEAEPHRSSGIQYPANKRAKPSPGSKENRENPPPIQQARAADNRAQRTRAAGRSRRAPASRAAQPLEEDDPLKRKLTKQSGRVDSGYGTQSSRENTFNEKVGRAALGRQRTAPLTAVIESTSNTSVENAWKSPADPVMIREPKSSPISQDQLAAEVRGIYASLVVIEAKCISIDSDQAANPDTHLDPEQNQTLIALHRTLLYEHHDFLMATQHPSSTPGLRGLAAKYSMPARMWKHGIHAYLEVLRHRRPQSQDFMMTFIYLAYQMMALLYETVPAFTDTWIECLGDLARYRMAIEEEREIHGIWGVIAGGWYSMAVDRHPDIGRLNHHLGILERPSLLKLFLYSKSLTCVIRFPNAKDSLTTLCAPIVRDEAMHNGSYSAEARLVTYHAMVFMKAENTTEVASEALDKLDQLPLPKLKEIGIFLIVANISAILELGMETNNLWLIFNTQIGGRTIGNNTTTTTTTTTTQNAISGPGETTTSPDASTAPPKTIVASSMLAFAYSCFNLLIRPRRSWQTCCEALPSVHCLLVWFHSLHTLRLRLDDSSGAGLEWYDTLFSAELFSWATLVDYLNFIIDHECIKPHITQHALDRTFPTPPEQQQDTRPLTEDYKIRGLLWTQFIFPPGWFDKQIDEVEKYVENSVTEKARVERVQWLGLYLAFHTDFIAFDQQTNRFWAPMAGPVVPPIPSVEVPRIQSKPRNEPEYLPAGWMSSVPAAPAAPAPKPGVLFGHAPKIPAKGNERNTFTKHTEARHDHTQVRIFGEGDMHEWDDHDER